jgi:NAD(P)-dependent dehydrogenase (short-subunit alcohol dehydrogenase family)
MEDLAGQAALVTGAASGIGRASALAFARAGAAVALVDVDADGLAATADLVRSSGAEAAEITADVADLHALARAVSDTVDRFGSLDAAHNNAGVAGPFLPLDQYPPEEFLRVVQVDLVGVWHCMRAEIAQMRHQGGGAIVNTSSMLGDAAMPDNGAYIAAKHGVNGLTRAAAVELAGTGIRVNAVAPGVTRTGMTSEVSAQLLQRVPLARIAEPTEIAAAMVWLCSPQASYVTGAILVADGGWLAGWARPAAVDAGPSGTGDPGVRAGPSTGRAAPRRRGSRRPACGRSPAGASSSCSG